MYGGERVHPEITMGSILKMVCAAAALFVAACAALPENFDRPVSAAYIHTEDTRLGRWIREETGMHPEKSGMHLLASGLDAFVARAVLARTAERSIDAQYFLLHSDLVGKLFIQELLKAADRGVRVRLLVDDIGLGGRDLGAAILDTHPHIEVRLFNPFSRKRLRISQLLTGFRSVRRRMHNKSFTADNQATIVGGRNIGDEYFDAHPALLFSDLDVLAVGPVVREVSDSFDTFWNHELAYPASVLKGNPPSAQEIEAARNAFEKITGGSEAEIYRHALDTSDLAQKMRQGELQFDWGKAKVLWDKPEKLLSKHDDTTYHLSPQLRPHFESLEKELILISPYFVPGKRGIAFLKQLGDRGVTVRILTNSLASGNHAIVHAGYGKYRKDLMRSGIELFEMKRIAEPEQEENSSLYDSLQSATLHTKSFIFDRGKVFVGSLNLDPRSVVHNTEIGVLFETRRTAEGMAEWLDKNMDQLMYRLELEKNEAGKETIRWHEKKDGKVHTYTVDPDTSFWRRFGIEFLSIFPIESQL